MKDKLSWDFIKICGWRRLNRISFNAPKTQSYLLTHRKSDEKPLSSGGVSVEGLGASIPTLLGDPRPHTPKGSDAHECRKCVQKSRYP